ncbi:MAG: hypothetical protein RIR70_587 [Pseudomonadota bacterium]|jgi:16S rRNA (cytosine967-C5)-methyltransferase
MKPIHPRPSLPPDSLAFALLEAARLIDAVTEGGTLTEALAAKAHAWTPAQRGAIMDLAYGTLRDFGRGDFFLGRLLHKPLTEPLLHALLRVALHRLERAPHTAHVLVSQAVEAAQTIKQGAVKGLANAVLRNFLRQQETLFNEAQHDAVAHHCHPRWWIRALQRDWPQTWQAILDAGNQHPPMSLRVNLRRSTRAAAGEALMAAGIASQEIGEAGLLLDKPCPVSQLPGFAEGVLSVQDAGAQRAAAWLGATDGMRVLDACAAPGGKTAHILERAKVTLLALDADATRAARITENLTRLGLSATVKVADCRDTGSFHDGALFDRILADVPCSASGVARRHPDIKWLRREADIAKFAAQQREILDALWPLLAPGGQMLYATCSVFRAENQSQVESFCARHPDAKRLPIEAALDQPLAPCAQHDGFYYTLIGKPG